VGLGQLVPLRQFTGGQSINVLITGLTQRPPFFF